MYKMGLLFEEGLGVDRNDKEAVRLYQQSAYLGNPYATGALALRHEIGKGVPQDRIAAERWLRKAEDGGVMDFCYRIGIEYYSGEQVPRDYARAMEFFKRAAGHGAPAAIDMVGVMYEYGL